MKLTRFLQYTAAALAVVAAVWLAMVWFSGRAGDRAYADQEFSGAEDRYSLAGSFMPFERWKALFGRGTAVLADGNSSRAEDLLAEALERTPVAKECLVRVNLSLAQEFQGDDAAASGFEREAKDLYETALKTLRDGQCPARDDTAAESEERLEEKLKPPPEEEPPSDPAEGGDDPEDGTGDSPGGEGGSDGDGTGPDGQDGDGEDPSDDPTGDPGGGGDGDQERPGDSGGSGGTDEDPAEADRRERMDRLQDQNRAGQIERQDSQSGDDWGGWGHSGNRGTW
ncbi:MAG: hypothetical protein LBK95_11920 [Bifidobacteriaceae bacterium]|jgi:hypothetical protein|nr:hypothetical protein [Bifidobacteriaceae bacterium]